MILPACRGCGRRGWGSKRDVGDAGVRAACEGGEPLDVGPEQAGEGVRLGLAQLGEVLSGVLHGAVTLAQLHHGHLGADDGPHGRGVAVPGEQLGELFGAGVRVGAGQPRGVPAHDGLVALGRERGDRLVTGGAPQEPHGLGRELDVLAAELGLAGGADDVPAGGAAPSPVVAARLVHRDGAVLLEAGEVAADGGGGEVQAGGQLGGRDRPLAGDELEHATARPLGVRRGRRHADGCGRSRHVLTSGRPCVAAGSTPTDVIDIDNILVA